MSIVGIIPSRYASTRFPGKPLVDINGKTMLQRVVEQAQQADLLSDLYVATDDERIFKHAEDIGVKVLFTKENHPSGTDRCAEAIQKLNKPFDYVLNIQGDEPFLNPEQINELCQVANGHTEIATQMVLCNSQELLFDNGEVKIVLNKDNEALYFSRLPLPFIKGVEEKYWHSTYSYFRHVGMYMYRADVLQKISQLSVSPLEKAESLEQLRWLENGYKIKCVATKYESHCIDTPEDLERVLKFMNL